MIWNLRECQADLPQGRLLVLCTTALPQTLETDLEHLGMPWDRTDEIGAARQAFFAWGGHDALLIAPGAVAGRARQVVGSLREMDPNLPILTFLDPSAVGAANPAPIALGDLQQGTELGRGLLRQRLLTAIHRSRS